MGKRASYEPGTFCWVDLATTDPEGAKTFYGELFGWEASDAGDGTAMLRRPGYGAHLAATVDPDKIGRAHV